MPVRWAMGAPLAALACMVFFVKSWGVAWSPLSVQAVVVAAWVCAAMGQWGVLRSGGERAAMLVVMAGAVGVLVYWAGWRLPRGLVEAALPVGAMAIFQGFLTLGRNHPTALRVAALGGSAVAFLVVASAPLDRLAPGLGAAGSLLRYLVLAALVVGALSVWWDADRLKVGEGVLKLARSVLFAMGVWLPMSWWRNEGILAEFRRPENLAFLALVLLVAMARPAFSGEPAQRTRRMVAGAALGLALAAAGGWVHAVSRDWDAPKHVFAGIVAAAVCLGALQLWRWPGPARPPVLAWFPESVFLAPAVVACWM